jgi:formate transporter
MSFNRYLATNGLVGKARRTSINACDGQPAHDGKVVLAYSITLRTAPHFGRLAKQRDRRVMNESLPPSSVVARIDALLPPEMALACEAAGAGKAKRDAITLLLLGVLAGAFIAMGAIFMTVVLTGTGDFPWGVARLLAGLVFSLGLILVVVGGAELFTGDTLMVIACASRKISVAALLRAWMLVYAGNIAGAIATAAIVFMSGHHGMAGGGLGQTALTIASAKAGLPTVELFFLAVLCNVLVCLAVWMTFGARSTTDKVMVIVPPIAAFVAAGFEHSIANLYLLPYGLALKAWAEPEFWQAIGKMPADFAGLTVGATIHNVVVSTIGNLIGGSILVGAVYWFVYLRKRPI